MERDGLRAEARAEFARRLTPRRRDEVNLDEVEQSFETHATFQHPNQIVNRESHLLAGLNQPLDGSIYAFIMCLAEGGDTLFKWRFNLSFVPRGECCYYGHLST